MQYMCKNMEQKDSHQFQGNAYLREVEKREVGLHGLTNETNMAKCSLCQRWMSVILSSALLYTLAPFQKFYIILKMLGILLVEQKCEEFCRPTK